MKDITIIGGGPAGLFALFYAGMRGAIGADRRRAAGARRSARRALSREIHLRRRRLSRRCWRRISCGRSREQAAQFGQPMHLGQRVIGLHERDGHFVLETDEDRFPTRAIIIAAGIGAFSPRRLPQACAEPWYGRGIYDMVTDPKDYRGPARRDHRWRRLGVRLGHAAGRRRDARVARASERSLPRAWRDGLAVQRRRRSGARVALHLPRARATSSSTPRASGSRTSCCRT